MVEAGSKREKSSENLCAKVMEIYVCCVYVQVM
jgi:hypothetical protein